MSRAGRISPTILFATITALFLSAPAPAFAALERVSGNNASHGFPEWYQDKTGLALEFCTPRTQLELDGGWCLLLPGDIPVVDGADVPERFPDRFASEHFYWAGGAEGDWTYTNPVNGAQSSARALLVLALEAAFANETPIQADAAVFGRIRIRIDSLPLSGTYRVFTPYGMYEFPEQVAGERLFFTEDIGIGVARDFTGALASGIGPFLLPSVNPGGPELGPVPGPSGGLHIASPDREGPVTGSPITTDYVTSSGARNPNIFRVEGPGGVVLFETINFSLVGRIFTGQIPGRVAVDRASYARGSSNRVDVYATGEPTTQGRIPPNAAPPAERPNLAFYSAACGGEEPPHTAPPGSSPASAITLSSTGSVFWGQSQPADVPLEICLVDRSARNALGQLVPRYFPVTVGDQVSIASAVYDPLNGGSLEVKASSSDELAPPTLTLLPFGDFPGMDLSSGQVRVTPLAAVPSVVRVRSVSGGQAELQVTTMIGAGVRSVLAAEDAFTVSEDGPATMLDVLLNDTADGDPIAAGTITILSPPQLGTFSVVGGGVSYTPNPNASGADAFTYTVSVGGVVSNVATATVNITPVNDAPVAADDAANVTAGFAVAINVLANDTDLDGQGTLAQAVNLSAITGPGLATASASGGIVTFSAATAGTYTFTYEAQDSGGLTSNAATVTVTVTEVSTPDVLAVTRSLYIVSKGRWRVDGTTSAFGPGVSASITIYNGPAETDPVSGLPTPVLGVVTTDASGAFVLDAVGPAPHATRRIFLKSSVGGTRQVSVLVR